MMKSINILIRDSLMFEHVFLSLPNHRDRNS
jgi:hypothetical protein